MPKIRGTRKQEAWELLSLLERGPAMLEQDRMIPQQYARQQYDLWAGTWIIPRILRLIPELKNATSKKAITK